MARPRQHRETPSPCVNGVHLFSLLARGVRLEIIGTLAEGERDVTTLSKELYIDVATVSRDLQELRRHALVEMRRDKKRRVYRLTPQINASVIDSYLRLSTVAKDGRRVTLETPL